MLDVAREIKRAKRLKSSRATWEDHWQQIAEVMLPRRADFTQVNTPGEKRTAEIYDSTPMLARRSLSASLDGLFKPKTTKWFRIRTQDDELNQLDEVKIWTEDSEERLFRALYNPKARFIQRSGEVDDDLVTFGTGSLFIGENRAKNGFLFRSMHLKDCFPVENGDGIIDTMYATMQLTARQAVQRYGDKAGETILKAVADEKLDAQFPFLWVVKPREERQAAGKRSVDMPMASVVINVKDAVLVEESGFEEFPFAIPRWDTASNEVYGRSPGMLALADSSTLQQMGKTLLVAGQKEVDPPLLVADDGLVGAARTYPGGITHFDAEIAAQLGRTPISPMNVGANIPLGREMQNDVRDQIWTAFFRNVLNLPVDGPRMSATEVLERKDEFTRTIGPVFGRLETDYIAVVIDRCFRIMLRAGGFLPPPEILQGRDVVFEFASPLEQARKQIEAAGAARAMELLSPFVSFQPEITDWFNGDEIAKDSPEIMNFPKRWMRTENDVFELREGRAQAQQAQEALAAGQQFANIGATAEQAPTLQQGVADALGQGQAGEV